MHNGIHYCEAGKALSTTTAEGRSEVGANRIGLGLTDADDWRPERLHVEVV